MITEDAHNTENKRYHSRVRCCVSDNTGTATQKKNKHCVSAMNNKFVHLISLKKEDNSAMAGVYKDEISDEGDPQSLRARNTFSITSRTQPLPPGLGEI